jgi:hypothetical protein
MKPLMLTYAQLAALPTGTRLCFAQDWDTSQAHVRSGTGCEISDNTLAQDDQFGCIALLPDDATLRHDLAGSDGCIILTPRNDGTPMDAISPLTKDPDDEGRSTSSLRGAHAGRGRS